jgi:predicted O-methyltransferase YrrM
MTEDRFTSSVPWCPNPQYWHSQDGEGTEHEVTELVAAFVRALQPDVAVETGTWEGQTTEAIGVALHKNGHGHLYAVEINFECVAQARRACTGLPVTVVAGDSASWDVPDRIGFAWVDSGTTRGRDIEHLLPRMIPGAVIGVHDAAPHHTVRPQLFPFEERGELRVITLRTPRGVSFAEVL